MKNILLPLGAGRGSEAATRVALDITRAVNGHLACLHVTPLSSFVAFDGYGGVFVVADLIDSVQRQEAKSRAATVDRLGKEGIAWDYVHVDGPVAQSVVSRARLADLIVIDSPGAGAGSPDAFAVTGDVVMGGRTPVLIVPQETGGFDPGAPAMVAWNGSFEAANALRAAVPLLRMAANTTLLAVEEDAEAFPATDAAAYLARHGIEPEVKIVPQARGSVAETLVGEARALGAGCIVMGAYGHSRVREYVFGGVTRQLLASSPVALFVAH